MSWYKDWFGEDYIDIYTHRNEQEAENFICTLDKTLSFSPNQKLLDLCCGAGRYSIALAKKGCQVIGLDLSEFLIERAKRDSQKSGVVVDFIIRDMRDIPYTDYFDGVFNMFTSFGYFRKDAENERVIQAVSVSLKQNAWFILDLLNRDFVFENFVQSDICTKGEVTIEQYRYFNKETNRIEKDIKLKKNGVCKKYKESIRLYSKNEIETIFRKYRLTTEFIFGNYDGSSFNSKSPRMILIGCKQ